MLTASSLPRAFRCLASAVHKPTPFSTQAAVDGNARHDDQEAAINAGDLSCLPPQLAGMVEGMDIRAEVALAYNWSTDTARVLGYGIKRDYRGCDALEIPGTADLVAVGHGRVIVADKKGFDLVEHPRENKQTLHNALCLARIHGVSEVTVCIHDEIRPPVFATLDLFDLESYANELRILQARMVQARKDPRALEVEGSHCQYCPALEVCGLKTALAKQIDSGVVDNRLSAALSLHDDETAADVYRFAQKVRALLKRLDARIYARAAEKPIPLGDGIVFGKLLKQGNRELDVGKVEQAIREAFADDGLKADAFTAIAIEKDTSQAAIERAAKAIAPRGKVESLKRKIIARTEELGGITRGTKEEWSEFKPQAMRAADDEAA